MLFLTEFPTVGDLPYFLTLSGYAFYLFRMQQSPSSLTARVAPETVASVGEMPALFMGVAWDTLLDGNVRTLIERDLLVGFLQRQRWFGRKARTVRAARFVDWGLLRRGFHPLFLTVVEVEYQDGERDQYFLPLAICGASDVKSIEDRSPNGVLARVTGARKGVLFDGWLDNSFGRAMLESIEQSQDTRLRRGTVRSIQTPLFKRVRGEQPLEIRRLGGEQSNTSLIYGDRLILKLFRRIRAPDDRRTTCDHRTAAAIRREPGRRLAPCDRRSQPFLRRCGGHTCARPADVSIICGSALVDAAARDQRRDRRLSFDRRNARSPYRGGSHCARQ
jgi:maltose alpha-D-glucosyltransferase/alpha-amylase